MLHFYSYSLDNIIIQKTSICKRVEKKKKKEKVG
jgi:hypothetical protein